MVKVSIIIPITTDTSRGVQTRGRLGRLLATFAGPSLEVVVGDSSTHGAKANRALCQKHGAVWVDAAKTGTFSPGYARDKAAAAATGSHLFLMDVDLVGPPGFAELLEKEAQALDPQGSAFLVAPCLYLTPKGTRELEEGRESVQSLWRAYLAGNFRHIINLASASSAILVGRSHYQALGGHNAEFAGHGFEDLDLLLRLTLSHPLGRIEPDIKEDVRQETIADSVGFRRYFTYYAIEPGLRGLVLAHLSHPRHLWGRFRRRRGQNERSFAAILQKALADRSTDDLPPLPPLGEYIQKVLEKHGMSKEEGRGFYKNQWRDAPLLARFKRKLIKLLTKPGKFFRDMGKG